MADHSGDPFVDQNCIRNANLFSMEMDSDGALNATTAANASKIDSNVTTDDPTFIRNQITIQRSPSTAAAHVSALTRKLSAKSNGSHEPPRHSILGVLDKGEERIGRVQGNGDSASCLSEVTNDCSLSKSPSVSTDDSDKSVKSSKSVRSVLAVGSYPLGSLRVHSPSPTRPDLETRTFLRSGDVILVRDVPQGSIIGYDTRGLVTKEKGDFEGIKAIPPGAHFLWGGASKNSLRSGFWIMTTKKSTDELGEIHVKRWDKENETLDEVSNCTDSNITITIMSLLVDCVSRFRHKLNSDPDLTIGSRSGGGNVPEAGHC